MMEDDAITNSSFLLKSVVPPFFCCCAGELLLSKYLFLPICQLSLKCDFKMRKHDEYLVMLGLFV